MVLKQTIINKLTTLSSYKSRWNSLIADRSRYEELTQSYLTIAYLINCPKE